MIFKNKTVEGELLMLGRYANDVVKFSPDHSNCIRQPCAKSDGLAYDCRFDEYQTVLVEVTFQRWPRQTQLVKMNVVGPFPALRVFKPMTFILGRE